MTTSDDRPAELRVVFTGHAGLGKNKVLERLCQCVYENDRAWRSLPATERKDYEKRLAQFYSAENPPDAPDVSLDMKDYLPIEDIDRRQRRWYDAINTAIEKWRRDQPRFAFLSLHLTYHWRSELFSPYTWKIVEKMTRPAEPQLRRLLKRNFRPHYVVTLIDDIAYVQHAISKAGFTIRLRELLTWRNIEILMSDLLANQCIPRDIYKKDSPSFPYERSPVVAIRHPTEMLYRLLFQARKIIRIYVSYPMTRTRNIKKRKEEIDNFRYALHEKFSVFDPVTIDDRVLQNPFESEKKRLEGSGKKLYEIRPKERWFIPAEKTLCGEDTKGIQKIRIQDMREVAVPVHPGEKSAIDRQITTRDFRLIDQADVVIIYRPQYTEGEWSGGTEAECRYAQRTGKRIIVIHDPVADKEFDTKGLDIELQDHELLNRIRNLSKPNQQKRLLAQVIKKIESETPNLVSQRIRASDR